MPKLMQDGDWRLVHVYEQYRILHRCEQAVYSWAKRTMTTSKKVWVPARGEHSTCLACGIDAPDAMQGMVRMLEWER